MYHNRFPVYILCLASLTLIINSSQLLSFRFFKHTDIVRGHPQLSAAFAAFGSIF